MRPWEEDFFDRFGFAFAGPWHGPRFSCQFQTKHSPSEIVWIPHFLSVLRVRPFCVWTGSSHSQLRLATVQTSIESTGTTTVVDDCYFSRVSPIRCGSAVATHFDEMDLD